MPRRKEQQALNTFHHVIMRGARDMDVVHNENDRWQLLRLFYYTNDANYIRNWERDLAAQASGVFEWLDKWPERDPLVSILAFCIHDNHFHLLIKQIREDGIRDFMHRMPNSYSLRYNKKYDGKGSIFQGRYKSRRIYSDADLQNVAFYIMIKNVFERAPGGLKVAEDNFEEAWKWALSDNLSSFPDYASSRQSPIIEKDLLGGFFSTPVGFKKKAKNYMKWRKEKEEGLEDLALE